MIKYVGKLSGQLSILPRIQAFDDVNVGFRAFTCWLLHHGHDDVQLDVETTVEEEWCKKKLICLQFGDLDGKEQWVIQWSSLQPWQQRSLRVILEGTRFRWYIHNALFECVVLLFHGIRLHKVYDTMLMELVLNCGTEFRSEEIEDNEDPAVAGFFSLAATIYRYLQKTISKEQQMLFGDDLLTEEKIIYGATDVTYLGAIARLQKVRLAGEDLEFVAGLENDVLPAFAEMTYHGMELDKERWIANEDLAIPLISREKESLDAWLGKEPFVQKAMDLGFYNPLDRVVVNWSSPKQKNDIVEHFFPFLKDKVSKAVLTKLVRKPELFSDPQGLEIARWFLEGDWTSIELKICALDREWLINKGYLLPGGTATINWNSQKQILPILQCVKKIQSTDAETLAKFNHPIASSLQDYRSALKLISTYGTKFFKYVESDGKVRTSWNQIVSTGRVSSRNPNMQNIPVYESVGTRYRNAFVCPSDWEYNSSDFSGQELVLLASISQEPAWMDALRTGQDLHSVCAELVFKSRWKDAADPDCAYYTKGKVKCNCKKHKVMRTNIKTVNFGIPYGMQAFKLAATLGITAGEATVLLSEYYRTFRKVKGVLDYLRNFGLTHGYIQTLAPFYRKRWFPYWPLAKHRLAHHQAGQYDATLGEIERESGNMPIQGAGGDMCKVALSLMYNIIHERHWEDKVHLVMQVHDQIDTICRKDFTHIWKPIMHQCMLDAALLVVPNGLLGADTTTSPCWSK